jgi:hypothetical protein
LGRTLRDADGPGLRLIGRIGSQVAQHGMPGLVVRNIEDDEPLKIAVAIKDLDAAVAAIGDIDVVLPVEGC